MRPLDNPIPRYAAMAVLHLLLAALVHDPACAGGARVTALGGEPGYLHDSTNTLHWYGTLVDHPDLVILEAGDPIHGREHALRDQGLIGHGVGVHVRLPGSGRWGTAAFNAEDGLDDGGGGAFSAAWARHVGPLSVGLQGRFTTRGESRVGTELGDVVDSRYFHRFGLGIGAAPADGLTIDLAADVTHSRVAASGALYRFGPLDDWSSHGLRARIFWVLSTNVTVVPLVELVRDRHAIFDDALQAPADLDARRARAGLGLVLSPTEDERILLGCEYRDGREDRRVRAADTATRAWDSLHREWYHIRCRAGVETELASWLVVRAGARYVRIHDDRQLVLNEEGERLDRRAVERVVTPLALGIGVRARNWVLDVAYDDTAPSELDDDVRRGYSTVTLRRSF